jgi:hypothetical protein
MEQNNRIVSGEVVEHDELTEQLPLLSLDGKPWYDPNNTTNQTIAVPKKGYGPNKIRLNSNQEAFCQAYCYGGVAAGNASKAYRLAYGRDDRHTASVLLRKPYIVERLEELNRHAIEDAGITAESWLLRQRRLSEKAEASDNLGVAANFEKLIGQAIGALRTDVQVTVEKQPELQSVMKQISDMITEEPKLLTLLASQHPDMQELLGLEGAETKTGPDA